MKLFPVYQNQIKPNSPTILDAPGASYSPTDVAYQVALIAHLPGDLNRGNHAAYVDVLGSDGQPLRNPPLRIGWTWQGRGDDEKAPPVALDKGPNDPAAGNVVIYKGMVLSLWLLDGDRMVSNVVSGLQTATPDVDPATGNSRFHNSFYVVFRPSPATTTTPPTSHPVAVDERLAALEQAVEDLKLRVAALQKSG